MYGPTAMAEGNEISFDELADEAAVLRTYRQVFAVLAREAEKMVGSPESLEVDEAVLNAFASAGSEGLTEAQVVASCRRYSEAEVRRRFEVLKAYGAITKVFERRMERFYRAAFAPYIMLLFLKRMSLHGGMAELHQLLAVHRAKILASDASMEDARGAVEELTHVFRLLANELASLAVSSDVEQLRENAQLLWGNENLIGQAEGIHTSALSAFPGLARECRGLRAALAAYADAIEAAAGRLIERAGTARGLGFLPHEAWDAFIKRGSVEELAEPLAGFVFDGPTMWFDSSDLVQAVESAAREVSVLAPPPRADAEDESSIDEQSVAVDGLDALVEAVEGVLGGKDEVSVPEVMRGAGGWMASRRVLADLTAAHHHPELPYELVWGDQLDIDHDNAPAWTTHGLFRRTGTETSTA